MIDVTGENLTQITYDEAFDSFPHVLPRRHQTRFQLQPEQRKNAQHQPFRGGLGRVMPTFAAWAT